VPVQRLSSDAEFPTQITNHGFRLPHRRHGQSRSFVAVILNGRPPFLPRARAEASPATVRSEINSRSNSASAAKIPNTNLPAAVVVSTAAP
jgi:hypothetical protein